jgi:hypothetical protein
MGRFSERARHDRAALPTRLDGQDPPSRSPSGALVSIHNVARRIPGTMPAVIHSRVVKKAEAASRRVPLNLAAVNRPDPGLFVAAVCV